MRKTIWFALAAVIVAGWAFSGIAEEATKTAPSPAATKSPTTTSPATASTAPTTKEYRYGVTLIGAGEASQLKGRIAKLPGAKEVTWDGLTNTFTIKAEGNFNVASVCPEVQNVKATATCTQK